MAAASSTARGDAIVVKNLQKSYGKLRVLDGISFKVKRGTIFALLGPNGAGKTTTIKILSTLLEADAGQATVNGYNVAENEGGVRESIGLTGQYAAVDEYLSGQENLELIGRLYRLDRAEVSKRTKELLEEFDLVEASKRPVKTYSGGMRRRLDLAMSLIATPPIIFLDEPTTGLDPRSRMTMWAIIKNLAENGTTILLTTQYMEEADQLASTIVVIDGGKVIAEGDPNSLKAKVGSEHIDLTIAKKASFEKAVQAVSSDKPAADAERRTISIATKGGVKKLKEILQRLDDEGVAVEHVTLRRPTLDDVFLSLTGHGTTENTEEEKK